jgi:hypothetical protein
MADIRTRRLGICTLLESTPEMRHCPLAQLGKYVVAGEALSDRVDEVGCCRSGHS